MKKKEYQKRKGENLARWCERIAAMCCGRSLNDVFEMISEVSKTSYIEGVHAEREVNKKFGKEDGAETPMVVGADLRRGS